MNDGYANTILAHEVGHYYFQDTKKTVILFCIFLGSMLSLALLTNPYIYLISYPLISLFFALFSNYISRKVEYRADLFSKAFCGYENKKKLLKYLKKGEIIEKHSLFRTHPTIEQRLLNIKMNNYQLPKREKDYLNYFSFMDSIVNQLKENDE